jgi:hypothetical protein
METTMKKRCTHAVWFVLVATLVAVPPGWTQGQAGPGGQVTFVSGGVGDDSAERMAALGKEFNLKLLFAAKDGHYLGEIAVTIIDAGNRKILDTVSEGPFLFAQIAPGKYQITANYAGAAQTRSTTIAATGRRELIFRWEDPPEWGSATQ